MCFELSFVLCSLVHSLSVWLVEFSAAIVCLQDVELNFSFVVLDEFAIVALFCFAQCLACKCLFSDTQNTLLCAVQTRADFY